MPISRGTLDAVAEDMTKISLVARSFPTESVSARVPETSPPDALPGAGRDGVDLGGIGKGPGGVDLGGIGKPGGLGDFGFGDLGGMPGGMGDFGGLPGPGGGLPGGLRMPGWDRMDGANGGPSHSGPLGGGPHDGPDSGSRGVSGWIGGTWDYGPRGASGSVGGGVTYGDYGAGVNPRGEIGFAKGNENGGSVTSLGDAASGASKAVGEGTSGAPGALEGMDWSRGTRETFESEVKKMPTPGKAEPNDLGQDNNAPKSEPTQNEKEKENETAVASNDPKKDGQAGKPDPNARPSDEGTGGSGPRANIYAMPDPEGTGGSGPRSVAGAIGFADRGLPDPDGPGGGSPVSISAAAARTTRQLRGI
jgi:hypothetical protein